MKRHNVPVTSRRRQWVVLLALTAVLLPRPTISDVQAASEFVRSLSPRAMSVTLTHGESR